MGRLRAIALRRCARAAFAAIGALALAAGLAACTDSSSAETGTRVDVTVRDFHIKASKRTVPAGTVVLHVTNHGPSTHEFNVDLSRYAPAALPLQADGLTVNEDAKGLHRVDSIEQGDLHHTADLSVDLKPGHYVLWCNLEGHYLGGMHVSLDVR